MESKAWSDCGKALLCTKLHQFTVKVYSSTDIQNFTNSGVGAKISSCSFLPTVLALQLQAGFFSFLVRKQTKLK